MLDLVGRLHPFIVHFPVALVVVAAIGAVAGLKPRAGLAGALVAAVPVLAVLGAVAAVAAVVTGWFFASAQTFSGAAATDLELHRWSAVVAAVIAVVAAAAVGARDGAGRVAVLGAAGGLVLFTGHLGGSLVHEDLWSFTAAPPSTTMPVMAPPPVALPTTPSPATPASVSLAATSVAFADVEAIFKRSCLRCHDARKRKGGLRLDDRAAAMAGGASGVVIVAGDAKGSKLFKSISLPRGHEDSMPSKGDPLSEADIALVGRWIDEGAVWP